MAKKRVKVVDRGFEDEIRRLSVSVITTVGIQGAQAPAGDHGGLTNAGLGAIHEFGAPSVGIPQRSFLRETLDANADKYSRFIAKRMADRRTSTLITFNLVGEMHLADIRNAINASIAPPNKPGTVARKGSSVTLIDSGQLKGALTTKTRVV
jgi:phage gpG-like protein